MSKWRAIPQPTPDPKALQGSVLALKENVEMLTGQRGGSALDVAVLASRLESALDRIMALERAAAAR